MTLEGQKSSLDERLREIVKDARTNFYHCGYMESKGEPCKCSAAIEKTIGEIKQAVVEELGEEEIYRIFYDFANDVEHIPSCDWRDRIMKSVKELREKLCSEQIT